MDTKADEQRLKIAQRALVKLASGDTFTRTALFNTPASPEGQKPNWQYRLLDQLVAAGAIVKAAPSDAPTGAIVPAAHYQVTVEAFERLEQIAGDAVLAARLLWPGQHGSPLAGIAPAVPDPRELAKIEVDGAATPRATIALPHTNGAAAPVTSFAATGEPKGPTMTARAPQVAPAPVAEPATVSAPDLARLRLPKLTADEIGDLSTFEATMLKLTAAILENDIYIRSRVERVERKLDEALEILREFK